MGRLAALSRVVAAFVMPSAVARRPHLPPGSPRRTIPRWAGPLVVCGLVLTGGVVFGGAYWEGYQLRREAAALARERDEVRRQIAQLREEVRLLHTPEYIERLAREQLGLVKPGELAIMLVVPTPAPSPSAGRDADRSDDRRWPHWPRR
jgi:hypothetical protein